MKHVKSQLVLLANFLLALSATSTSAQITAAVAANVQYAMDDLKVDFKKQTGIDVKTVFGASGKLATQIKTGAPFDVFISADMEFPDSLHAWGYASEKPVPYAYGKLVLWTIKDIDLNRGLSVLLDSTVSKVALADPLRAPYGKEAVKALRRTGIYHKVFPKLVYGENIAQVSQYILSGNAQIGFNAKSVVVAKIAEGKGKWKEVDSTLYDKIAQGAVICKYGRENHPGPASQFFAYLYSKSARDILSKYGYVFP